MNSPAEDLQTYLGTLSALGLTLASNLFIAEQPAKPNNCVTVIDTGGYGTDLGLETQGYERPSIQILVRNTGYIAGYDLAQSIQVALHGLSHQTINGTVYTVIQCTSGPASLGQDESGREQFSVNFNAQRR